MQENTHLDVHFYVHHLQFVRSLWFKITLHNILIFKMQQTRTTYAVAESLWVIVLPSCGGKSYQVASLAKITSIFC